MPHIVNVGGITTRPAKPLPNELQSFFDNAEHGVILVTFGSVSESIPIGLIQKILSALRHRQEKVILKYPHLDHPPKNMIVKSWLPQNDILGQAKMKLFITHGGNNGQFEAMFHGVPMLVLPMFAEQPANARRVQYKGYGEYLNLLHATEQEIQETVDKIITIPSYKRNIQKASRIYRSNQMTATERMAYWIEHVLEFGGDHLHSIGSDLPWYRFLMIDVLMVFIAGCIMLCISTTGLVIILCRVFKEFRKVKRD